MVADEVADMVVDKVAYMEVDKVAGVGGPGGPVGPGVRAGGLEVGAQRAPRLLVFSMPCLVPSLANCDVYSRTLHIMPCLVQSLAHVDRSIGSTHH